jgi:hypothetical protein
MIDLLRELERRRMALQGRCTAQRMEATLHAEALLAKGAVFDRAVVLARGVSARPLILGAAAVLTVAFGPRRLLNWALRGTAAYGVTRRVFAALGQFTR